ncbi:SWIM zinc finger family protein [Streptomyces sp. AC602_WCS936]|uniref:SWIM zinc finger family protein n=1 Tax=Streptomyces sp. AC602_WCS936 TaxID=2823685 RepID=UPI001C2545AD|nr:SWIM zinc finger family protein [Streptomyces sp. AC602_WCS936]
MTPRPADEARRALREARERGEEPQATTADTGTGTGTGTDRDRDRDTDTDTHAVAGTGTGEHATAREPARQQNRNSQPHPQTHLQSGAAGSGERTGPRPGDIAREALRNARIPGGTAGRPDAAPAGPQDPPGSRGTEADRPEEATRPTQPSIAEATTAITPANRTDRAAEGRPADVAREALRAARRQPRPDPAAKGTATSRRSAGPARTPQRTGGTGTAAARARAVRDFAAGAFRLPPDADAAGEGTSLDETAALEELPRAGEPTGGASEGLAQAQASSAGPPTPPPSSYAPSPRRHPSAPDPERTPTVPDGPALRPAHPAPRGTPHREAHGNALPTPPAEPPAQTRTPRSMAAPDRDGELRRTFPALPPRSSAEDGFAATWWGNAWVTALEEGALDTARLARGRGYAERGNVDAITVTPGLVLAYVQGSRPRPYRVQVRLRTLDDTDWERFLDAAVERPGHIAALLDKELPHSLADCGVPLLPGPGDLAPQCSCPDSGHPCKHAAALCYQTARLLDADPFVLLLLRGRGERTLLDDLSRRNAARTARAAQDRGPAPLPGVRATEALAARTPPPLPPPLPPPPHPEQPPAYPAAPGGPDSFALDQLATDAAARAHALLTTGRDPVGGLTLWQDAVRLAAARPGSGLTAGTRALYASLAGAAGRDTAELARAVAAWRQGGLDGLDVLEDPWDPPAGRFDRARPLLLAADLPAFRPWRNRLTHPQSHVQLRLGRTGLWYAYESEPGRDDWWPRGTPDLDPVGALTGLGASGDL